MADGNQAFYEPLLRVGTTQRLAIADHESQTK